MKRPAFILILWFGLVFAGDLREQTKTTFHNGLDPNEQYFTYIPIGGMTNQFLALTRAMEISATLNRTLLLPPIVSSPRHNPSTVTVPWSTFFDMELFKKETGLKVLEYHQFRKSNSKEKLTKFPCISTFNFNQHTRPSASSHFLKSFSLRLKLITISDHTITEIDDLYSGLKKIKEAPFICVSDVFSFLGSDKLPWLNFGVHLQFETNFTNYIKKYIAERIGSSFEDRKYIAIHVRRGDFHLHCDGVIPPDNDELYGHCLPSIKMFEQKVNEIKLANPKTKDYPVIVATNEKDKNELTKMNKLGWNLNSTPKAIEAEYGEFGPQMVDAVLLVDAEVSIGVRYSTFFKVAKKRSEAWYHNENSYYL